MNCFCGSVYKRSMGWYGRSLLCEKCNTVYTPMFDADIYNESYRDKYIEYHDSPENEPLQEIRWDLIGKYCKKGKVLDIGCGVGAFAEAAGETYDMCCQDINPACVEYCRERGLKTFSSYNSFWNAFDVITMWDVIEHLENIDELNDVLDALKKPGYLIVSTPNFKAEYAEDIENWRHYRPYEHVWNFSEGSFNALARKFGLTIMECNFNESEIRQPDENILTCVMRK